MYFLLILSATLLTPGLSLVKSDEKGLTISYSPTEITIGDIIYIDGATYPDEVGVPCIPQINVYVAVPPGSKTEINLEEAVVRERKPMEISPVPDVHEWGYEYKKDSSIYGRDVSYPPQLASTEERGFIRDQEFVLLKLQPITYNPLLGLITIYDRLMVNVSFRGGGRGLGLVDSHLEPMLAEILINYDDSKNWRQRKEKRDFGKENNQWIKIEIEKEGIYKIDYNQLRALGMDPDFINPMSFRLFTQGGSMEIQSDDTLKEIPIYLKDEAIYFYATPTSGYEKNGTTYLNIFTDRNIYWLTHGGIGKRDSISGFLGATQVNIPEDCIEQVHIEEDSLCPAKSGRGWAWFELKRTVLSPRSNSISFEVPKIAESACDANFYIYGYTKDRNGLNMQHDLKLYLNDQEIIEETWRGGNSLTPHIITAEVSDLQEGENTLIVELWPGEEADTLDWVYFDYLELHPTLSFEPYNGNLRFRANEGDTIEFHLSGFDNEPLIFNIEDELNPIRVTDITFEGGDVIFQSIGKGPYFAATNFKIPNSLAVRDPHNLKDIDDQPIDYLIITCSDFKNIAQELIRYREERYNITGMVVLIGDVYNNFSFGLKNPYGVRNFLKFAYENWNASYVLLLGSGTYDYRSEIEKNRIPPWEEGYHIGQFGLSPHENPCYDNWFAMVSGEDNMPDMVISRITAESRDDARTAVEKIINYEKSYGPWRSRILLSADDEYGGKSLAEQIHTEHTEYLASITPSSYDPFKVYLINYAPEEQGTKGNLALIETLNQGVYYGVFMGHGNYKQLAHENIWTSPKDVNALSNSDRYSIFFYGSCGVGAFDRPYTRSTADLMQISQERGSIATIAATRSTYPADNTSMSTPLYNNTVVNPQRYIGDAFLLSFSSGSPIKYILFGDPMTDIRRYSNNYINTSRDTLLGGLQLEVSGRSDDTDNGFSYITLYDSERWWIYNWNTHQRRVWDGPPASNEIEYSELGDIVYRGLTTLNNNMFLSSFFVPIELDSGTGKVSGYLWDEECGGGMAKYLPIAGRDLDVDDEEGPEITAFVNGKKISDDVNILPVKVDKTFTLSAILEDSSGVMLQKDKGIRLEIKDGGYYHLEEDFEYDIGSSIKGQLLSRIELNTLYTVDSLMLIVRDNINNESKLKFAVEKTFGDEAVLENPINYPNPVKGENTRIEFYSSKEGMGTIKIFTISGRLIKTLTLQNVRTGVNAKEWDIRDEFHDKVGNGIYLYKIEVKGIESTQWKASCIGKMMIMR